MPACLGHQFSRVHRFYFNPQLFRPSTFDLRPSTFDLSLWTFV
jgi:hypothetical protein